MPAQKRTLTGKAASQTTILPRLDFVDLRLVINVAAAKSLTRGAELSALSPAAASMRGKNVEDAIGTALLYRGKRGISRHPPARRSCGTRRPPSARLKPPFAEGEAARPPAPTLAAAVALAAALRRSTMKRALWPMLVALSMLALPAQAQWNPARPIRIVVPYPPGGGSDVAARTISERMSPKLGQPVLVENRPGAGGIVGTDTVFRAEPDGYTLLLGASDAISIAPICSRI